MTTIFVAVEKHYLYIRWTWKYPV